MKRYAPHVLVAVLVTTAVVYMVARYTNDNPPVSGTTVSAKPDYVGVAGCTQCHQQQVDAWRGSHHDLAMQHATDATVLGDFNDRRFEYYGVKSVFSKRDGKFFVKTDGPGGALQDYEIKYTFGVEPLQQYLVELEGGHLVRDQSRGVYGYSR